MNPIISPYTLPVGSRAKTWVPRWRELEDCAPTQRASSLARCAIERALAVEDHAPKWITAGAPIIEVVEHGFGPVSVLLDRARPGILIFSTSKGREFSNEGPEWGGGVFTNAVINALSNPKTDRNHNGVIEASELYATVKRAVVEATWGTDDPQTPWFARNDMVGDFVPF